MEKKIRYLFVKYTDDGVIEKEYTGSLMEEDELKQKFEEITKTKFDPETSYIKPVIDMTQKIRYDDALMAQLIFDCAMNLLMNVKNKYAVADDLIDLSNILSKKI